MIRRYRETGDMQWRSAAIEAYMPLARRLAKQYHPGPEPFDDLLQVACVGLVKAVDRFDPRVGTRFGAFAIPTIMGELRRYFRDATWAVHVPRGVQEDMLRIRRTVAQLSERLGRSPSVSEIAAATRLDNEQVVEALLAGSSKQTVSLERPAPGPSDGSITLGDALGRADDSFELVEERASVGPHLRALGERQRTILFMRFARDMTQSEIAARFGCSQMQISRELRRALKQLAEAASAEATSAEG
ncbi:MAG TPA: SigB/SigF/SigG family RNA polymerase sigma factor [Conexibacter sp.]